MAASAAASTAASAAAAAPAPSRHRAGVRDHFTHHPPPAIEPASGPIVESMMATVSLGVEDVDLRAFGLACRNCEVSGVRTRGALVRLRGAGGRASVLVHRNGRLIISGARTMAACHAAARHVAAVVKRAGLGSPVFGRVSTHNVMGMFHCGFAVALDTLFAAHPRRARFEPELFPGLVYRLAKPSMTVLVFTTGRVVLTGASAPADLKKAHEALVAILAQHKSHAAPLLSGAAAGPAGAADAASAAAASGLLEDGGAAGR